LEHEYATDYRTATRTVQYITPTASLPCKRSHQTWGSKLEAALHDSKIFK